MLSGKLLRHGAGYGMLSQAHLNCSSPDASAEAAQTRPGCAGAQTGVCIHSGGLSACVLIQRGFLSLYCIPVRGRKTNTSPAGTTRLLQL